MRILLVTHAFPRAEGDLAGAFLQRLGEALTDRGHEILVLAPADRGDVGPPRLGRVEVRRVRYASPGRENLAYSGSMERAVLSPGGALAFLRLVRALGRGVSEACRAENVHLVHAHWWVPGGLATSRAERAGRPFLVTLHGSDVRLALKVPGGKKLMASVLRRAAVVTAVSSYLADAAARTLSRSSDTIPITPMPLVGGIPTQTDIVARHGVVFVGRLTPQKGVHVLLAALAMLKHRGLALPLTVVGDGPLRPDLKAQALALGVTATFVGFVAPEEVPKYLVDKRLLVLPSLEEGLGLVVAEALTHAVPVVATRSGGIPDLLTEPDAGILTPPGAVGPLADAIRTVATDDRFLRGARRAGRMLQERLSPERLAERFEQLYLRARGGRRSSAGQAAPTPGAPA
jgi:glycosyltransferase involved in cell wall biosynthesis